MNEEKENQPSQCCTAEIKQTESQTKNDEKKTRQKPGSKPAYTQDGKRGVRSVLGILLAAHESQYWSRLEKWSSYAPY